MVILPGIVADVPVLSVTSTVKVNVPALVGVPRIDTGGDVVKWSPGGSAPDEIEAVNGPIPPLKKKFCR
jgi:hypothetical protein